MRIAIAIAAVGLATSVNATPYYVGENLKPTNNITLNFQDTMVKKEATSDGESGNIAALELKGVYNVNENIPVAVGIPFYIASKGLTGESENFTGNGWLSIGWNNMIPTEDREMTWGYSLNLATYLPTTGDRAQAAFVAGANSTTDFYKYSQKTTSVVPTIGVYMTADQFSTKLNAGYGYGRTGATGVTKKNLHTFTGQFAASWHAMPNLAINAEYNTIYGTEDTFGDDKFRHAATPSISGNYESFLASLYANIPLDEYTRDIHNVSFGLNTGYTF